MIDRVGGAQFTDVYQRDRGVERRIQSTDGLSDSCTDVLFFKSSNDLLIVVDTRIRLLRRFARHKPIGAVVGVVAMGAEMTGTCVW